ncbi:branched-chain amino acid transport protein AzlD [mine drainage metagenome]|uniref:Branched-chain amino acid transport protein AzlD n=1 Tax=mine drainage metagenome TaxID=410659 RepID=A0A1J5P8Y0_9ZZZZ
MTLWQQFSLVAGMTAVTILSRNLFLLPRKPLPLPSRVKVALRFAPAAALAAVVAPELLLVTPLGMPWVKIGAAVIAAGYFFARRGILGTILSGMLGYWALSWISHNLS